MSSNSLPSSGTSKPPKYCRQKGNGRADRAYIRIGGKKVILGTYGSADSHKRYAELIGGDQSSKPTPATNPTVAVLMAGYLEFAKAYYPVRNKRRTSEYHDLLPVMRHVKRIAGPMLAKDFGPRKLKEVRQVFVDAKQSRETVNRNVRRVRRMFRWGASEEIIPGTIWQNLAAVEGLKAGRSEARECPPVEAVNDAIVDATLASLPEVVADMVRLQRLTGMRPGEVCKLRPCDIDRTGEVWIFKPAAHKTSHLGKSRVICIGPRAQEILLRYLARAADDCCFNPRDSEVKRRAAAHAKRKAPLSKSTRPGQRLVENPTFLVGNEYCADSYRRAIGRGCDKAFPAPDELKGKKLLAWKKSHRWFPNQLRHSALTETRDRFGLEHSQAQGGHAHASTTEIYARASLAKAIEVAKLIG